MKKNLRPFRLTKNGVDLNLFSQLPNEEQIEKTIPKSGYIPNINLINEDGQIDSIENNDINIEDMKNEDQSNPPNNLINSMMNNQPNEIEPIENDNE